MSLNRESKRSANIDNLSIIDPAKSDKFDFYAEKFF